MKSVENPSAGCQGWNGTYSGKLQNSLACWWHHGTVMRVLAVIFIKVGVFQCNYMIFFLTLLKMQNPGFLRRMDGWSSCQQKPHDQAGTFPLKVKDFYDEKFSLGSRKIAIFQYKSNILAKSVSKR
jgi:hypothetical protein